MLYAGFKLNQQSSSREQEVGNYVRTMINICTINRNAHEVIDAK